MTRSPEEVQLEIDEVNEALQELEFEIEDAEAELEGKRYAREDMWARLDTLDNELFDAKIEYGEDV